MAEKLDLPSSSPVAPLDFSGSGSGSGTAFDWFRGFAKSAAYSIPELIGINAPQDVEQFRQENPVSGVVSELAGSAVPYLGWFRAAKAIPAIEKAAQALGSSKNMFLAGAGRTAATLAPFEAGRVAANQAFGDQSLTSMLGATATDLALGSGIGGLLHGISYSGTRDPKLPSIFPGLDISLPLPLMARQMREIIDSGKITDPDMLSLANRRLTKTLAEARTEELGPAHKYIGDIGDEDLERQLNRMFRGASDPDAAPIRTRKFSVAESKDFKSEPLWRAEAQEAGLPDGFEEHGQYFRAVNFNKYTTKAGFDKAEKTAKAVSKNINDQITKGMDAVGDNTFMAREADDGMFVLARKYKGNPGKGTPDDRWVLFKTDKPGYFLPDADRYATLQVKIGSFSPNATLFDDGGPAYNTLKGYLQQFPFRDYTALAAAGPSKLLPKGIQGPQNEFIASLGDAANEFIAPSQVQFRKSPRANYIFNGAKVTTEAADATAEQILYGKARLDPGKSAFRTGLQGKPSGVDGLPVYYQLFKEAGDEAVSEFKNLIWKAGVEPAQIDSKLVKGEILPATAKLAKGLEALRDWLESQTNKAELAVGRKQTKLSPYALPKTWEGYSRYSVIDDSGNVVAHAGGGNRKEALRNAERLIAENPTWRLGEEFNPDMDPAGFTKRVGDKRYTVPLAENQNLRGYKWDLDTPTSDELFEEYGDVIRRNLRYQSNISVSDILDPEINALNKENPQMSRVLQGRLNDLAGVQSPWSKAQNRFVDRFLGPMLGTNSASNIVAKTNSAMMHFTLGAMRLAYPAVNALQAIQTVAPEIAFMLGKAPEERLAQDYSILAAGGTKGPIGGMAVLNPLKLMANALREMWNPSEGLRNAIERGVNEKVLAPKVVEEYVGKSASKITNLRAVLKGEDSFFSWLTALSEFLPAESERLSRTHAFTVGYKIARDFLTTAEGGPLSEEALFHTAKQFTERTMYGYKVADRSRIWTTPAGSALGLFKNWQMHYYASMMRYGEELSKGNFAPLLWQTGGTMALGGFAATPLIAAADKFSKLWSDKGALQLAYDNMGESADYVMYGLPPLLGLALTSQVDTPALANPVRDGSQLFSLAAWGRVKALNAGAKAGFDHWQTTGEHPGYDRKTREELIKAFAPNTVYRSISAFANPDAISSIGTGYPIIKDPSFTSRLLYASGFNPVELEKAYDVSKELYENRETLKAQEQALGLAWAQAEMDGNGAQMATIMRQGFTWGVDISKVIKNGMYELNKQRKDIIERGLRPRDIGAWRNVITREEER